MLFRESGNAELAEKGRSGRGLTFATGCYAPSPIEAYSAVRLLRSLANNLHIDPMIRDEILQAIAVAVEDPRSSREVYLYEDGEAGTGLKIRHVGKLEEVYFQTLLTLGGVADLDKGEVSHRL